MAKTLTKGDLFEKHRPILAAGLNLETTYLGEILIRDGLIDPLQHDSIMVVIKLLSYFFYKENSIICMMYSKLVFIGKTRQT